MNNQMIPLFPLKSIVLPGGIFPLRIFERRYIDMVKNCIKNDTGFCIVLVRNNSQKEYIDDVYNYGCYVEISKLLIRLVCLTLGFHPLDLLTLDS